MEFGKEAAQRLCAEAFWKFNSRFIQLSDFRRVAALGMAYASDSLHRDNVLFAMQMTDSGEFDKYFIDKQAAMKIIGGPAKLAEDLSTQQRKAYTTAIDAACLVFAHSILDASALQYLRIAATAKPEDFDVFIGERKISLNQARQQTYDEIRSQYLEKWFDEMERESLLKKLDRIHEIGKPQPNFDEIVGYTYDRDKVENLDRCRHDVVHGDYLAGSLGSVDADLQYLQRTSAYVMAVIQLRYDLKMNVSDLRDFLSAASSST